MMYYEIKNPYEMVEYLIDCTLATVETMLGKKATPKKGEFERQCGIAQKGIDFLGTNYKFTGRAKSFASKMKAYDYYMKKHKDCMGEI